MQRKCKLTSFVSNQFSGMLAVRALNQDQRRKDYLPVYIFTDCTSTLRHYEEEKNTKRKVTHQCQYCDTFFRYKHKCTMHIKRCSGRQGFIYCFQDDEIKSYENYIKHKIGFSFNGGGVPGNHYMIYIGIGGKIYVCNLVLYYVQ